MQNWPQQIDDFTTHYDPSADGSTFTYLYEIYGLAPNPEPGRSNRMKANVAPKICKDQWIHLMIENDASFAYSYSH